MPDLAGAPDHAQVEAVEYRDSESVASDAR